MFDVFKSARIYLDYASATPVLPEAFRAMVSVQKTFANPGSLHAEGVEAKRVLEGAREGIASELGCKARQIIFTSGLTESNNLGILGVARRLELSGKALKGTHWITSSIEHSSVLECFAEIERQGGVVSFVDPEPSGIVAPEKLQRALRKETVLISIGWGNNEIGIVQNMGKLSRAIRAREGGRNIMFHTDAGQAPLYLSAQVHSLGVDMMSIGSGKLYGPRGIGALYIRDASLLAPVIVGGGQEKGLRSGTEEVVLAAGFAAALEVVGRERNAESKRLLKLRDELARELVAHIHGVVINGDLRHALPHMLNVSIPGTKTGEYLALQLDHAGIAVSTKSACDEGNRASHVVAALGGEEWRAINTLRLSLGRETSARHLRKVAHVIEQLASHRS